MTEFCDKNKIETEHGKVIEEYNYQFIYQQRAIWEEKLRLHINPKPDWMPMKLWAKILNLVIHQTVERK